MVLSMERWVGRVAVVTGASSGIGAAIAEALVEQGLIVAGLARRKDRLDALAQKLSNKQGTFHPVKTDISKEEDILNAFKWIKENLGPIHVLVNNAGVFGKTTLADGDTEIWKNILDVNVLGLCIATREAIRDMRENNVDGHIIHINSVTGHQVTTFPNANLYPASKFAVTALAETLRLELLNLKPKIKITSLSPGPVDTEIFPDVFKEQFKKFVENKQIIEAENVADGVVYVLSTPPHVQIQELTIRSVDESFRSEIRLPTRRNQEGLDLGLSEQISRYSVYCEVKKNTMVLSMDRWVGKVAIVTGASSGIGHAIAVALVEQGLIVAGLARRKNRLDALAKELSNKKGKLHPIKTDMTKEEDIINAFKWVKENLGPVHILINNAGVTGSTSLADGDTEIWKNTLNVNVLGLSIATREAIRDMRANKVDGHIIHINSIAGHQVTKFPDANVYSASKFAVTALAETLRLELLSLKSKIKITSLSPGPVDTEIFPDIYKERLKKFIEEKQIIEPENIADGVVYVLSTPPHVQIQELTIRSVDESFRSEAATYSSK
ncbi:uncharacterized protein LOC108914633 [Anoplophora glabripennis]|nr:uncharacterized protein LOC108914633 [Anoplophora glabripennis]